MTKKDFENRHSQIIIYLFINDMRKINDFTNHQSPHNFLFYIKFTTFNIKQKFIRKWVIPSEQVNDFENRRLPHNLVVC